MVYRPESVMRRIEKLQEFAQDFRELPITSFVEYERNKTIRYAAERLLVVAAETIIDILDHLLAARHSIASDTYEEVVSNAHSNGLLSDALFDKLKGIGGMRNALTHQYLSISNEQVFAHFCTRRELLPIVTDELRKLVSPP